MARTVLIGVAGFLLAELVALLVLGATGGAGAFELRAMTVLAMVIGVSVAIVVRGRARARRD
jgi:hypothetical protein